MLRTQTCSRPVKHGRVYGQYTEVYTIVYMTVQMGKGGVTAMKQADTRWQYSDSSEAYNVNLFKYRYYTALVTINVHFNVSVTSRDLQTSHLGLVSAGEAKRLGLVSFPFLSPGEFLSSAVITATSLAAKPVRWSLSVRPESWTVGVTWNPDLRL